MATRGTNCQTPLCFSPRWFASGRVPRPSWRRSNVPNEIATRPSGNSKADFVELQRLQRQQESIDANRVRRPSPAEQWDQALLACESQARGTLRPSRCQVLPLLVRPERKEMVRIDRRISGIRPALRAIIRSLLAGEKPWPLVLLGPAGTGKTCAALCLLDHAGGSYWTVGMLCDRLIQAQQGRLAWPPMGRGGPTHAE